MENAKAKTINLLLYEGNLGGVISIEDSSWNSGELYSAPRESVSDLLDTDACKKYGVYLLLSKNTVYVGQSSDLAKRINQHTIGKDWWESVVILTTKDDSLNHADIDFLESVLINKAKNIGRLDCDNKNKGNNPKVDKFRSVFLEQYLDEALFLMQLIGIKVFCDSKNSKNESLFNPADIRTKLASGKRAKAPSLKFLTDKGISIDKKVTYAVRSEYKPEYWANPQTKLLNEDWTLVLNDTTAMELIVLRIPKNTFSIEDRTKKLLLCRKDKPDRIDLNINEKTFVDRKSGANFKNYIVNRVQYGE